MTRLFSGWSPSSLLPLYLALGFGNLILAAVTPDPAWALGSFFGVMAMLLAGLYLRWSPAIICTVFAASASGVLAHDRPSGMEAAVLILAAAICGLVAGGGLELLMLFRPRPWSRPRRYVPPDEPILAELVGPPRPPAKVYSVPRRYDLSLMLVVVAAYAMLFGAMQTLEMPPAAFICVAVFFTLVGAGQALLFGGKQPRLASEVVGGVLFLLPAVAGLVLTLGSRPPPWVDYMRWLIAAAGPRLPAAAVTAFIELFLAVPLGAFFGYVAGGLIGGIFLVSDAVRTHVLRRNAAEADAEEENAEA